MTKIERLTLEAAALTEAQIEDLIAVARYLRSQPHLASAPAEILASIDRGIANSNAGRVRSGPEVFRRLHGKISANGAPDCPDCSAGSQIFSV